MVKCLEFHLVQDNKQHQKVELLGSFHLKKKKNIERKRKYCSAAFSWDWKTTTSENFLEVFATAQHWKIIMAIKVHSQKKSTKAKLIRSHKYYNNNNIN